MSAKRAFYTGQRVVPGDWQGFGAAPRVEIRKLKDVGYLHDIGKIILDTDLLNKNYPLDDEELAEMKRHATVGYRILNSFDFSMDLAEAVLAHHERWDGTGYPRV